MHGQEFFETFQALCDALRLFDSITPHRHWLILLPVILGIRDGEYAKAIHVSQGHDRKMSPTDELPVKHLLPNSAAVLQC